MAVIRWWIVQIESNCNEMSMIHLQWVSFSNANVTRFHSFCIKLRKLNLNYSSSMKWVFSKVEWIWFAFDLFLVKCYHIPVLSVKLRKLNWIQVMLILDNGFRNWIMDGMKAFEYKLWSRWFISKWFEFIRVWFILTRRNRYDPESINWRAIGLNSFQSSADDFSAMRVE